MSAPILTLALSEGGLAALLRASEPGGPPAALPAAEAERLTAEGALAGGRPAGMLADGLEAVREPVCELLLERGQRRGRGWADGRLSVLFTPGAETGRLVVLPTLFLCEVLARMNDLGPRPRHEPALRLRYAAGALAEALAARDPARAAQAAEGGEPEAAAARGLVEGLREHWRIEARWAPAPESPGVRVVEVVDTDAGVWLVVPDDGHVELWPSTPTTVWRLLSALLPRDHELAAD